MEEDVVERLVLLLLGVVVRLVLLLPGVVVQPQAQQQEELMYRRRTSKPSVYGGPFQVHLAGRSRSQQTIMPSTSPRALYTITMVCSSLSIVISFSRFDNTQSSYRPRRSP